MKIMGHGYGNNGRNERSYYVVVSSSPPLLSLIGERRGEGGKEKRCVKAEESAAVAGGKVQCVWQCEARSGALPEGGAVALAARYRRVLVGRCGRRGQALGASRLLLTTGQRRCGEWVRGGRRKVQRQRGRQKACCQELLPRQKRCY